MEVLDLFCGGGGFAYGFQLANAVCFLAKVEKGKKTGELTDQEIEKLDAAIKNPKELPIWMLNRRKDYETGEDRHIILSDIRFIQFR